MRKVGAILVIGFTLLYLMGCTSISDTAKNVINGGSVMKTTEKVYPPTDPNKVQIFLSSKPKHRYKIIGQVSANTDTLVGLDRSESDIKTILQQQAASLGGNAIIDLNRNLGFATGTVIIYK